MAMAFLFIVLFIGIFAGVPIAFCLGGASIITMALFSNVDTIVSAQLAVTGLDSFALLAVPFFTLAGDLMSSGGISRRIVSLAKCFVRKAAGSLAMITVGACAFFAALSGSGPATVSAIGTMMIPEMVKEKYDKTWATAITCCGGVIGPIIPPSIPMVLYGVIANCSIGEMFVAGIVPGLLIAAALCVYSYFSCKKSGFGADAEVAHEDDKGLWATFKDSFAAILTPLIILGGIYSGVFTPTEAAIVACIWAIFAGVFIYKELTLKTFFEATKRAALTTSTGLICIACATSFGYMLTTMQMPAKFASFLLSVTDNKYVIILLILGFLLVIGCFIDNVTSVTILAPILIPIVTRLGYSLTHFGVFMTIALAIGFVTPPYGANLFVASGITGISVAQISKKLVPMIGVLVICLLLVTFIEPISMWLPSVAYGK
ncbi:TRAP transporter large permease [uncultured Dysosmobacter sp.]|uniref:TRAP transporter large permease n=1 Tax=uncultured Dysosmobacter sp. TaxID=2591384 RepID=UPI0026173E69|nr:TRAP transporter large permease [uncultured Dysosmobacter sp.]